MYYRITVVMLVVGSVLLSAFYRAAIARFKRYERKLDNERRELVKWQRELEHTSSALRASKKSSKKF